MEAFEKDDQVVVPFVSVQKRSVAYLRWSFYRYLSLFEKVSAFHLALCRVCWFRCCPVLEHSPGSKLQTLIRQKLLGTKHDCVKFSSNFQMPGTPILTLKGTQHLK